MENLLIEAGVAVALLAVFIVPRWRRWRAGKKMEHLDALGKALPRIVTPARTQSPFGGSFIDGKLKD